MELDSTLRKVRGLIAKAEHESTPADEAASCRQMADVLMLKYAIDDAQLDASKPVEERGGPEIMHIDLAGNTDLLSYVNWVAHAVAAHSRCKIRSCTKYDYDQRVWKATVYGYKSDLLYFEILYTTLRLHMTEVFTSRWDDDRTFDENVYRLHNAGFNWADIAKMRGWVKMDQRSYRDIKNPYSGPTSPEVIPSTKMSAVFKAGYLREAKRQGTTAVQIPPGGAATYRKSAARGYASRIGQRLHSARQSREEQPEEGALVLRRDDLDAFFKDQNPDLFPEPKPEAENDEPPKKERKQRERKYVPPSFNEAAYAAGARHADTADLGGNKVSNKKNEIG
jgi:Protein of unknown function (DUF2786)